MNYSFVTYLGTDNFLPGALALNASLKLHNKKYGLVVLVCDLVTEDILSILEFKQIKYKKIRHIENPLKLEDDKRNFKYMFTKLRIFEMIEFDKLVYLDADMLICNNIERLFDAPHMSAVVAGGLLPGNELWKDFNAGFLVVVPNRDLFDGIVSSINCFPSNDGGDQGFLNSFYNGWSSDRELCLDHKFNIPCAYIDGYCDIPGFQFSYKRRLLVTNIYVIHYWGRYKPWEINVKLLKRKSDLKWEQALVLWWDTFLEAAKDVS